MEEKTDLRIRKTYKALCDAFVTILEKKRFDDLTVNELCDEAMIRRATFYKHFAEMATIYSVFANTRYNPGKVYIIATQVDTLNRPKENWAEQQKEWLKYLKGNGAYASLELAQKNLVPVSAYLYTLLKQYNDLNEEDDKYAVSRYI